MHPQQGVHLRPTRAAVKQLWSTYLSFQTEFDRKKKAEFSFRFDVSD
jgi:hypothetical protein